MGLAFRRDGRRFRLGPAVMVAGLAAMVVADAAADEAMRGAGEGAVVEALGSETPPAVVEDGRCLEEIRRACCCPGWSHYAIFDVLFLQRNAQLGDRPLVFDADSGDAVMTSQDLQPGIGTGMRLFYGRFVSDDMGWEIGYTGVYGMFGEAVVTGPDNLELPSPLGLAVNNFNDAEQVRATYGSTLNIAECNVFLSDCCRDCGPDWCDLTRGRPHCHCVDWLAGFIWAGLDEQAGLTALCCDPLEPSSYDVRSSTNYFGGQIGMRGRRQWRRWAVEGWWKTALCGTSAYQAADPIVGTISGQERGSESAWAGGVGFIGGVNGSVVYRLTDRWGLRAGYNLYWLTGAALAPTQWDFSIDEGAGSGINDNGGLFLHGANIGSEYRW